MAASEGTTDRTVVVKKSMVVQLFTIEPLVVKRSMRKDCAFVSARVIMKGNDDALMHVYGDLRGEREVEQWQEIGAERYVVISGCTVSDKSVTFEMPGAKVCTFSHDIKSFDK